MSQLAFKRDVRPLKVSIDALEQSVKLLHAITDQLDERLKAIEQLVGQGEAHAVPKRRGRPPKAARSD